MTRHDKLASRCRECKRLICAEQTVCLLCVEEQLRQNRETTGRDGIVGDDIKRSVFMLSPVAWPRNAHIIRHIHRRTDWGKDAI